MPHPTLLSLQLHRSVAIPGPLSPHPTNSPDLQPKSKTYDSRYSPLVTHESTSLPIRSLSSAERTGCSIFSTGSMAVCTWKGSVGCLCMLDLWTRGDRGASWDRWTRRCGVRLRLWARTCSTPESSARLACESSWPRWRGTAVSLQ